MKKFLAILLSVMLVLSFSVVAFATDGETETPAATGYTITIANGLDGETYTAYKIFDVTLTEDFEEGVDGEGFAYSISAGSEWYAVVTAGGTTDADGIITANGLTFTPTTKVDANNNVIYAVEQTNAFSAATFAALLAQSVSGKTAAGSIASYSDSANTITVDELGYYFVTTSLGALCSLDTTTTDVTIYEKNTKPSIEKQVKDDDDDAYAKVADTNIGDTVNYKLTVNTGSKAGVTDDDVDELPAGTGVNDVYTIVDTLPEGINVDTASVIVTVGATAWTLGTDYTVAYDAATRELTIVLQGANLQALAENTDITITYDADVDAAVDVDAANTNTAVLTYKEQESSSTASVYTWSFDVLKYTGDLEDDYETLAGATFTVSDAQGTVLKFVQIDDTTYRYDERVQSGATGTVADPDDATATVTVVDSITTTDAGTFQIIGLDSGEYVLTETEAPLGYNALKDPVEFEIQATAGGEGDTAELTKTVTETTAVDGTDYIAVENNTGSELPSTGGIGTTIFYIIGAVLVLGAAIILIARRRTSATES